MTLCNEHSGFIARLERLEGDVRQLWNKWDFITKATIAFLTTAIFNLVGILYLIVKTI